MSSEILTAAVLMSLVRVLSEAHVPLMSNQDRVRIVSQQIPTVK